MNNQAKQNNMRFGGGGAKLDKDKIKDYALNRVIAPDRQDEEFWQLIKQVPKNTVPVAAIGLVLNIILPGFGTLLSACLDQKGEVSKSHMVISLLQFLTAIVLVGWIWAIYWSYLIFLEAQGKGSSP